MKKAAIFIVVILTVAMASHARPKYIVIQKRLLWGWKLKHVEKPEKRLERWGYDKPNDTYFAVKTSIGLRVRTVVGAISGDARYISVRQGWTAWKISGSDRPPKKLHKWHLDPETGSYYRIRYYWGTNGKIW